MSISTDYNNYSFSYSSSLGVQSAQSVNSNMSSGILSGISGAGSKSSTSAAGDTASFSSEALLKLRQSQQAQQKPEELDFENMSDDEIKSFLSDIQEKHGGLPAELGDITSIEDMTSEQVQSVRESLVSKQSEMAAGMGGAGRSSGPPPSGGPGGAGGAGGIAGIEEDDDEDDDEETELEKLMAALDKAKEKKAEEEKEYQKKMSERVNNNFAAMSQMMPQMMSQQLQNTEVM